MTIYVVTEDNHGDPYNVKTRIVSVFQYRWNANDEADRLHNESMPAEGERRVYFYGVSDFDTKDGE